MAEHLPGKQVISKQRVTDHGEVYTRPQEVRAMLNLVRSETERIESRFLEPACGSGNFLVEVLWRKLRAVALRFGGDQLAYERNIKQHNTLPVKCMFLFSFKTLPKPGQMKNSIQNMD